MLERIGSEIAWILRRNISVLLLLLLLNELSIAKYLQILYWTFDGLQDQKIHWILKHLKLRHFQYRLLTTQ